MGFTFLFIGDFFLCDTILQILRFFSFHYISMHFSSTMPENFKAEKACKEKGEKTVITFVHVNFIEVTS